MSDTVHYKGHMVVVLPEEGDSLEDTCKRVMQNKELPIHEDSYEEWVYYEGLELGYTIVEGKVYKISYESVDPYLDVFNANISDDGNVNFEVKYYNGGCSFPEALEEALKNAREESDKKQL